MFDQNINVVAKFLDVSALRHKVVAHNIANVNTSNFKRKEVVFEDLLQNGSADNKRLLKVKPQVVEVEENERVDDNSTYLQDEVGTLTKNNLLQQAYLRSLTFQIRGLNGAIRGHF
ncbi:flagellar basal body rod protein FlgB [Candidatus Uabimicrobium amorphum]|uniref:Flagellar basal body rod protein FlgB n=1 Tax=Uabimicrobium amorphum TaxID=2596890 RepID=A0A5S9INK8_UABAM|nr:flagellar biosynthesis protein FlgB [Candidatus Uabimicrobium amorphum]BBM85014.1 flagellar basal body rod protein FlgB [Candidatus Uabimicrobium amorphum]